MINEKIKELEKEILGEEMELLDLDNACRQILNSDSSLFDSFYDSITFKFFTYYIGEFEGITIEFEILDDIENIINGNIIDIHEINVKVKEISEF